MSDLLFQKISGPQKGYVTSLRVLLDQLKPPFNVGDKVGIKLHWGERGNRSFLPPVYAREIVRWLWEQETKPFLFDTTVLYSGGRRTGKDTLKTAAEHGYTEEYLGCPFVVADGMDGRDVVDIPAGFKYFETVQVASLVEKTDGFVIFSHFKGHLAAGFGGAVKNISMGFASRAQKQRMHSDVQPVLIRDQCIRCGVCCDSCPAGAAQTGDDGYPAYDLKKCIGCAQCIALCPEVALKILWDSDDTVFQEKLVETAAAVWKLIKCRSIIINALLNITTDCDCLGGKNPAISTDIGFIAGRHPVTVDAESLRLVGADIFDKAHPDIPWRRQFTYAGETGFLAGDG
jgi:uncharacterized Fe-S center protein